MGLLEYKYKVIKPGEAEKQQTFIAAPPQPPIKQTIKQPGGMLGQKYKIVDTGQTQQKQGQPEKEKLTFGGAAKGLGKFAVSLVSAPVRLAEKLGTTIGQYAAEKIPLGIPVSEETKRKAAAFQAGLEAPSLISPETGAKPYESWREAGADILETGLTLATPFLGGAATAPVKGAIGKVFGQQVAKKTGTQIAKQVGIDMATGAGYGTAEAIRSAKTPEEAALLVGGGSVLGVVAPKVFGAAIKGTSRVLGGASKLIGGGIEKVATALEQKAGLAPKGELITPVEEILQKTYLTPAQQKYKTAAELVRYVKEIPGKLKSLIDPWAAPKKLMQEKVEQGKIDYDTYLNTIKSLEGQDPRAGALGQKQAEEYIAIRTTNPEIQKDTTALLKSGDMLDRLARGEQVEGGLTAQQIQSSIDQIRARTSPENLKLIDDNIKAYRAWQEGQLKYLVDNNFLTPEAYERISQAHPNYVPEEVLQKEIGSFEPYVIGGQKKVGIFRTTGSELQRRDIDEVSIERIIKNQRAIQENNAKIAFVDNMKGNGIVPVVTEQSMKDKMAAMKEIQSLNAELKSLLPELSRNKKISRTTYTELINSQKELQKMEDEFMKELLYLGEGGDRAAYEIVSQLQQTADDLLSKKSVQSALPGYAPTERLLEPKLASEAQKAVELAQKRLAFTQGRLTDKEISMLGAEDAVKYAQRRLDESVAQTDLIKQQLAQLQARKGDIYGELSKLRAVANQEIPEGMGVIKVMRNGFEEKYLAPKDVANNLMELDFKRARILAQFLSDNWIGKILTTPARMTRLFATSVNPTFGIKNLARDLQTTSVTADRSLGNAMRSLLAMFTKNDAEANAIIDKATQEGVFLSNIFNEFRDPAAIAKQLIRDKNSPRSAFGTFLKNANPINLFRTFNEKMENATRLNVFWSAIKRGLSPQDSAYIARNATIDFTKIAPVMRVINQLVPYLNARVQGFANMTKAMVNDPERFTRVILRTAVYPQVLLTSYNTKYPSYDLIPDYEKRQFWILMIGESDGIDSTGEPIKVPHYIKIPKGEAQIIAGSLTERILDVARKDENVSRGQFLKELTNDISPIQLDISAFGPILLPFEIANNKKFFTKTAIEPETQKFVEKVGTLYGKPSQWAQREQIPKQFRYKATTPEIIKWFVKATADDEGNARYSPAQIQHMLDIGLMGDIIRIPQAFGFKAYKKEPIIVKEKTSWETMAELPFIKAFFGTKNYQKWLEDKQKETETQKQKAMDILKKY